MKWKKENKNSKDGGQMNVGPDGQPLDSIEMDEMDDTMEEKMSNNMLAMSQSSQGSLPSHPQSMDISGSTGLRMPKSDHDGY